FRRQWRRSLIDAIPRQHMFNTLTQHRWPFNSAVQGDKRCRYAAERHRAKTLATSSVTSKVNPGRQYQAAATRVLTSGQSSFDSVKPGIPFYTRAAAALTCDSQLHLAAFRSSGWRFQMPMTRVDRAASTTSSVMV